MKRPTKPQEIELYELEIEKELFGLLRARGINVTIGGISEDEYFSYERRKKFKKKSIWEDVSTSNKKKALKEAQKGEIPVRMGLPPIIFSSTAAMQSGVPYLNVSAVSWLNKETPRLLPHALLSLVKET